MLPTGTVQGKQWTAYLLLCPIDFPNDVGPTLIDFAPWRTLPGTLFLRHLASVSLHKRNRQAMVDARGALPRTGLLPCT